MKHTVLATICIIATMSLWLMFAMGNHAEAAQIDGAPWNETWTDKVKRDLFLKYDKFARPSQHFNTTVVEVGLTVIHLSLNDGKSILTTHGWLQMLWTDEKLKWEPSDYGGLTQIHVGNHEVWQPDIAIYNSATASGIEQFGDMLCIVYDNGNVVWVPPVQLHTLCELDIRLWPFDTQHCQVTVGSWTFHGGQVDLRLFNASPETETDLGPSKIYIHNSEWELLEITRLRNITHYACCEEPYITIIFTLTMQRKSPLYYGTVVTPTAMIVFLILVTFWLPPQSEQKININASVALIITIYLIYFGYRLPALANSQPLIVCFYSGCLCLTTLSLIISALVINLSRRTCYKPLPRRIKRFLLAWPGMFLGLGDLIEIIQSQRPTGGQELHERSPSDSASGNVIVPNSFDDCDRQNMILPTKTTTRLEWILFATAIDRVAFLVFCHILALMAIICLL